MATTTRTQVDDEQVAWDCLMLGIVLGIIFTTTLMCGVFLICR